MWKVLILQDSAFRDASLTWSSMDLWSVSWSQEPMRTLSS